MTQYNNIYIKNIYYMLCYAFRSLHEDEAKRIEAEEFDNAADLLAELLVQSSNHILRCGIYREFNPQEGEIKTVRGRLNLGRTLNEFAKGNRSLICEYDDFSEDNVLNQILACTLRLLLANDDVNDERKTRIQGILRSFSGVSPINPRGIKWSTLAFHGNNREYRFIMSLCRFVLENMVLTTESGKFATKAFVDDEAMCRLYEKFLLEYYRKEHPNLRASPSRVEWNIDNGEEVPYLPAMITDISLYSENHRLIIDAKFYGEELALHQGKSTYRSANLYQIFSYVKNADTKGDGSVSGMLLYAKTDSGVDLGVRPFHLGGNEFSVRQLDLNRDFSEIRQELDNIASAFVRGRPPKRMEAQ